MFVFIQFCPAPSLYESKCADCLGGGEESGYVGESLCSAYERAADHILPTGMRMKTPTCGRFPIQISARGGGLMVPPWGEFSGYERA